MKEGTKIIITCNSQITGGQLLGQNWRTIDFLLNNCQYRKGMRGVIVDVNASGDKWKVKVRGKKELLYVPIECVEELP